MSTFLHILWSSIFWKIFVVILHLFLSNYRRGRRKTANIDAFYSILLLLLFPFSLFWFLLKHQTIFHFSLSLSLSLSSVKEFWICLHFFINHRSFLLLLLKNRTAAPLFFLHFSILPLIDDHHLSTPLSGALTFFPNLLVATNFTLYL